MGFPTLHLLFVMCAIAVSVSLPIAEDSVDFMNPIFGEFGTSDKGDTSFRPSTTEAAVVSQATSDEIQVENDTEKEAELLEAFVDLEVLEKVLQVESKYIEGRMADDSSWPASLAAKVGSKTATSEEKELLNEDLSHTISAIIVMKMMEEKLSFINGYTQQSLTDHQDVKEDNPAGSIVGGKDSDKASAVKGIFELKYLEGVLHSINSMIEASLSEDVYSPVSQPIVDPEIAVIPVYPETSTDDISVGIGAFVVLLFTAIGFFFVLFLILYTLLKLVRKCFEGNNSVQKRSKYEQI